MSETVTKDSSSENLPPVELANKYDATQLKNAVDDEIARPSATLRISGKMEKYTSKYPLTLTYSDKLTNKSATTKIEPNVATWFTTKGTLVHDAIDSDLKSYVTTLQQQLHQE
ncbi:hypothetical protein G6F57_001676 [Rhizopus arrhizus]|uniref:Signal peptidase complex subunit 2 n=1 Tax=Rhizopus oryzae TaxID=64495 RepID=A0A9P6XAX9_RHIOR|nr:hypothetical protein G6F23_001278 [Rhizopus arrhizus]KAG0764323.1 hypothetical protein G6F24_005314 [Rhizopus arrhizus]KAG0793811.1 hypothetical protein G6F21_003337 [Rhizopus arrhizus]KAG0798850.1 hypothetical protein G6F22_003812 [Rhizopus arrhizus]KAG0819371.1 hypothetical protein G6F20_000814 [Rhizopus arrhizus]